MSSDQDRRQTRRYSVRLSAEISHGDRAFTTITRDLSLGGVSIETTRPLAAGTALELLLFLVIEDIEDPTFPTLTLQGTVAWSSPASADSPPLAGVRFVGPTPAQAAVLQRLMQALG